MSGGRGVLLFLVLAACSAGLGLWIAGPGQQPGDYPPHVGLYASVPPRQQFLRRQISSFPFFSAGLCRHRETQRAR